MSLKHWYSTLYKIWYGKFDTICDENEMNDCFLILSKIQLNKITKSFLDIFVHLTLGGKLSFQLDGTNVCQLIMRYVWCVGLRACPCIALVAVELGDSPTNDKSCI